MRRVHAWVAAFGLAEVVAVSPVRAELITFEFEGQVTELHGDVEFLGGTIFPGLGFQGSYTFDSTTPDGLASPLIGSYQNGLTAFSVEIGPHVLIGEGLSNGIDVTDEPDGDSYSVQDNTTQLLSRNSPVTIVLWDSEGSVFSSDALPLSPPPLEMFEENIFQITDLFDFGIIGQVTSLAPEPTVMALLLLGSLFVLRRRGEGYTLDRSAASRVH